MSRFFKSAAFPIVVVVVLAFFAQKMIIDNSSSKQANTWNEFTQAANTGKVQYLKTNLGDNSLKYSVTKADGSQTVTIGIPSTSLMDQSISAAEANNAKRCGRRHAHLRLAVVEHPGHDPARSCCSSPSGSS